MNQREFVEEIVRHLQQAGLPYMVTGSVASGRYGELRATYDTDIVVDAEWPVVQQFVRSFGEDYYVSEQAAQEAWAQWRMFNIIHFSSGNKADIMRRKNTEYSRVAFSRRRREAVLGTEVDLCSPEDIILAKLDWSKKGESERQFRDALGVFKTQGPFLNTAYLIRWAAEIGVAELLTRLLRDSGIDPG